ncbi:MAG: PepSY-like domain-containing protein [Candidatus Pseudobacter hemicellulosilyticus]|uniref:PepSY-like domain-containing protein n=1 Tax=Candidatus Pseudobacter hemicellulosilyticus TaxID=3121375 RepID=A0AAJ5WTX7_9BACT|nr:MAG: PepSY-like domain-containing protein [Pseudobacter sp.]
MRNLFLIAALTVASTCQVFAQDKDNKVKNRDVPEAVRASFDNNFDNTTNLDWRMKDGNYKAMFQVDLREHMAEFNSSGELLSKGQKIERSEMPTNITDAVKTGYAGDKINEVYRIEKEGQIQYMVKLNGNPKKKIIYDSNGTIVKDKIHKKQ